MKLTKQEQVHLDFMLAKLRKTPKVLEMKNYIQHGRVSTYEHCESVTRASYWINRRFHLGADEKALIDGAFLHDFYLYDWHISSEGLHGFYHPGIARKNAVKHFKVNDKVQNIIYSHMWPLTVTNIPRCREAWIVCLADKYISTKETLFKRKYARRTKRKGIIYEKY